MLSEYAKLYRHLLAVREERARERGVAINMQRIAFILARLKIIPSYHQELVSHPVPDHNETCSLHCQDFQ